MALQLADDVGVKAKLEYRSRPGFPSQLCVEYLIGPITQCAWGLDPHQNIGIPEPPAARQRRLHDAIDTGTHRSQRILGPRVDRVGRRKARYISALCLKVFKIRSLMLEPTLNQRLEPGLVPLRGLDRTTGRL